MLRDQLEHRRFVVSDENDGAIVLREGHEAAIVEATARFVNVDPTIRL
jgi:hypothetical protein